MFKNSYIAEGYTVAGPKENDGRYKGCFDLSLSDDMFGEKTFEKAERRMFEHAINGAIAKANLTIDHIDAVFGGDLLNQIVSCAFAMRNVHSGFFGLYNACATFVESLILGAGMLNNGLENVLCVSGSHFSTAERQYRYPLELGVLRSPVTQWTATGVGCSVLTSRPQSECPKILKATVGRVVDYEIMDTNNMGAAMAPAIAIIGLCGMILPRISNTKIYNRRRDTHAKIPAFLGRYAGRYHAGQHHPSRICG